MVSLSWCVSSKEGEVIFLIGVGIDWDQKFLVLVLTTSFVILKPQYYNIAKLLSVLGRGCYAQLRLSGDSRESLCMDSRSSQLC